MENIIIPNQENFEQKLSQIQQDGVDNLHILADFDRTLTKAFVNGKTRPSLISVLRSEGILGEEYSKKAYDLFNKYHPIEVDPNIDMETKKKKMVEWWESHKKLLIETGLTKQDIEKVLETGIIQLRDGVKEFILKTNKLNIPFIILSANGLGTDSIKSYLEKEGLLLDNVFIVSNQFVWDENGKAVDFVKPVIHTFNKGETALKDMSEIFEKIKNRKNVIILGDSLGDTTMADGFDYKTLLKIGFLNNKIEELLEDYKKAYDIVILNDGDFSFVNKLI